MTADTRGIRELARQWLLDNFDMRWKWASDQTLSNEDRECMALAAFAESIVEQCCKDSCKWCNGGVKVESFCGEPFWHKFVLSSGHNLWEKCKAAALRSRWQRGEGK